LKKYDTREENIVKHIAYKEVVEGKVFLIMQMHRLLVIKEISISMFGFSQQ